VRLQVSGENLINNFRADFNHLAKYKSGRGEREERVGWKGDEAFHKKNHGKGRNPFNGSVLGNYLNSKKIIIADKREEKDQGGKNLAETDYLSRDLVKGSLL